jgi:hypothetical protein
MGYDSRYRRNTMADIARAGMYGTGLAALGYGAYKGYKLGKSVYNVGKTVKDVYQGAQTAMAAKGAAETAKMLQQGASYMPTIPGGFPSKLSVVTQGLDTISDASTPFFTAVDAVF